ncbi:MAG: sulfotransferase domain-containing protein [Planctomycetes bacterium]|nr:sulfotransferase domain-containing protein [Planctomycetota bacterium]
MQIDGARVEDRIPAPRLAAFLPNFLVISPPKTGSTWLAANLSCHPEIFIPEIKEVHFFNHYLFTKSWDWYTELFRGGLGLKRGEATPGYCRMPPETIRLIHSLMPRLKLIYLLREPIGRAWSHARHCCRHRLTTFKGCRESPDRVTNEKWLENLAHDSSLQAGLVLEHLRCWLACYPKEQIHIDFYPAIRTQPTQLLNRIFKFLGVSTIGDFSFFPVAEKLNEGLSLPMPPPLHEFLRRTFAPSARELAVFLRAEYDLSLPATWEPLLRAGDVEAPGTLPVGCVSGPAVQTTMPNVDSDAPPVRTSMRFSAFEKSRLVLKHTPRTREKDYLGYHLVHFKGQFFGLAHSVGAFDLRRMTEKEIVRLESSCLLFRSPSLEWVKLQIANRQLARWYRGRQHSVFRVPRFLLRRLGAFASAMVGRFGRSKN